MKTIEEILKDAEDIKAKSQDLVLRANEKLKTSKPELIPYHMESLRWAQSALVDAEMIIRKIKLLLPTE